MKRESGLTLIEAMIVMAMIAITLSFGVPSFQSLIRNNRLTVQANDFLVSLNYCRSVAVKSGQTATISTTDGSTNWHNGWQVIDNTATVIWQTDPFTGDNTLTGPVSSLSCDPNGFFDSAQTFTLCHAPGLQGRQISVFLTGRPSAKHDFVCVGGA